MLAPLAGGCAHLRAAPESRWPSEIREYLIPDSTAFPNDLAVDTGGVVWYTDRVGSRIGRLDPETGEIRHYPTPTPRAAPYGIAVAPDGGVWYAGSRSGSLGRLDPATGEVREFPIPGATHGPTALVVERDRVWFTLHRSQQYGWLDPRTGEATLYPFEVAATDRLVERGPYALTRAADGGLWFTALGVNALFRIDRRDGSLTPAPLPDGGWGRRLASDRRGGVWYTNFPRSRLGRLDARTGEIRELPLLRSPANPYGVAVDPDDRVWFNEARSGLIVGYDPRLRRFHVLEIPTRGATVRGMVVDARRRRVWLPLSGTHRIGRIDLP